jgi:hypothetical protein
MLAFWYRLYGTAKSPIYLPKNELVLKVYADKPGLFEVRA